MATDTPRALLWPFAALLAVGACDRVEGERPTPLAQDGTGAMQGGAAEVDITPIPGFAMGGHAIEAQTSIGVWTHLRAHAIYLEDADGVPLVLVACDLWSVSAGLADRVAELLHENPETRHIGREHLILGATHTHHSPGNFSSSRIYNQHASQKPGFDPDLFDFMSRRIAWAIGEAVERRVPVRLHLGRTRAHGVARNRSIEPFLQNPEAREWLARNADAPPCERREADVDLCQAVDPSLHALSIHEVARPEHTVAVAGFFAVHATTMPNFTGFYHADLFGLATDRGQAELVNTTGEPPVVALFNGPQGDVSPNWDEQGLTDTVALGRRLGRHLVEAGRDDSRAISGNVTVSYHVERLADRQVETASGEEAHASRRAVSGRSQIGGAEDGRTIFYRLGIREGHTTDTPALAGQGAKPPVVPLPFMLLALPAESVPDHIPLTVANLGPLRIATLPGEFTTILGHRVREEIQARGGAGEPVLLVGLGNEYLSYFTTPEEYALQHYEGASMLYGEDAGTVVRALLGRAAAEPVVDAPATFSHRTGQVRRFGLLRDRVARRLMDDASARSDAQAGATHGPTFSFSAPAPTWPASDEASPVVPVVSVQTQDAVGAWNDLTDGTGDARSVVVVTDMTRDEWTWEARLIELEGADSPLPPLLGDGATVRFHVSLPGGEPRCSTPLSGTAAERAAAEAPC